MLWFLSYWPDGDSGFTQRIASQIARLAPEIRIEKSQPHRPRKTTADVIARAELLLLILPPDGACRLNAAGDPVRLELAVAVSQRIPMVPLLISHNRPPAAAELPPELVPLAEAGAVEIRHVSFHEDLKALMSEIRRPRGATPWTESCQRARILIASTKVGLAERYMQTEHAPAQVLVDGVPQGVMRLIGEELEVEVDSGDHVVVLQATGRWPKFSVTVNVSVRAGETAALDAERHWLVGTLSLLPRSNRPS